ncbi:MAG: hypothetical protein II671_05265, partial [Salinivirgaceae bacterium]|nr:hypothetical protein [Salinivirgaceae bacterium]
MNGYWNRAEMQRCTEKQNLCKRNKIIIYSAKTGFITGLNLRRAALLTIWNFSPAGTEQHLPTVPEQEIST